VNLESNICNRFEAALINKDNRMWITLGLVKAKAAAGDVISVI